MKPWGTIENVKKPSDVLGPGAGTRHTTTDRMELPDGWLVRTIIQQEGYPPSVALIIYHDPKHEWKWLPVC